MAFRMVLEREEMTIANAHLPESHRSESYWPEVLSRLDPSAAVPLYRQLREVLQRALTEAQWRDDQPLPSEREMSEQLNISRATVRQAIHELELEGWLVRRQGRGTFPAPKRIEQPLKLITGFSENMRQAGMNPGSRLLEARLEPATIRVARALRLPRGGVVAVVTRLRLADDEPLMLERAHLNYALTPGLLERDLTGSLYETLTRAYRLHFATGDETVEAITADPKLAKTLGIKRGAPVLYTQRTVTTDSGAFLEFTERFGRADKCSFRVTLEGDNTRIGLKALEDAVSSA
jgi:GntR family transcriptional regulator